MTMGVFFNSGYEATMRKPSSMVRSWFAMPMRTWPFV